MSVTEKKTDVIVIGELNVDIILNEIDSLPVIGKEIMAKSMSVTLGSSSAIFASNLSALGPRVAFIGKIGKDNFAEVVLSSLEGKNVDTSHIIRSESLSTGATIVLNYNQDRANVTYPGAMNDLKLEDIDFGFLSGARHMHFANCFMQPGIRHDLIPLFRKAKELGLTTSLDTQWDPEEKWELPLEELLPYVDIFLPNMAEFKFLSGCSTIEAGISKLKKFARIIVIKNGSEGALMWDGNDLSEQPAFINDTVVDCVGAGDSFDAGFIKDFIQNLPLKSCLETGALTGAINTTRAGGTGAFENQETVRKIALERFNYKL
ncbi:MAG: carbohydrate kinase family protein [Bacteroidales bacterium]|nr:carbohydrate kinase family protein [Bacteroidales bacterium]MBK8883376.1 carbohydrate kinase family protein [Bacteroidales bacterium]